MSHRPGDRVARRTPSRLLAVPPPAGRLSRAVISEDPTHNLSSRLVRYGVTVAILVLITLALFPLRALIGLLNIGLIYLIVVVGATIFAGRWTGILAALLGFAFLDFFLVPPYLTFFVADLHNILALFVFLGVSALISWLIANAREQARQAQRRADDVSRLYELTQAIISAQQPDDVLLAIAQKVRDVFAVQVCWILLPGPHQHLQVQAQAPATGRTPNRNELALAEWAVEHSSEAAQGGFIALPMQGATSSTAAAFMPLRAGERTLGVLGVADKVDQRPLSQAERTVLATFADHTAVALDRLLLLREAQRAELLTRTDELKSALMSAVSHDLRTPLASIIAAVTSLLEPEMHWDAATRHDFLQGIYEEAERLNRLVGNLLDMSRIEGGALHPQKDWYSLEEVIASVVGRMESRLAPYRLTVAVAPDLPLIPLDFTEIDQVLTNLLENAVKYTPPGTAIQIEAQQHGQALAVSVTDSGPGVPAEHLARLFDKFYQVDEGSRVHGMGLGLAISKGLVEAHGGQIAARNVPGGGLQITFTLPIPAATSTPGTPVPVHTGS